ncbi:MAG: hypothetical protein DMD87_29795 [Candidatus Rokuibacteriota bacterium]|nr:MAG: hypothetical protein DMD87_29795 [Candidatus Rokubacteria bacterium]
MSTEQHNETPRGRGRLVSLEPRRRAANRLEEHLVSLLAPHSADAERYRMLRNDVETFRKNDNLQVLAVTSALAGDGKTTTAINLAASLAQSTAARVLLADVDLRRPSVARQVGLDGSRHSLVDALVGPGLTLEDMVEQLPQFNLSVLQAGEAADTTYELLKSSRLKELVDEARRRYDYIVLDTPPFVPVPDGRLITKCADGVLVVLAANRTPRGALAEALSLIDPAKIVGLVFNGDDSPTSSSYYGGYVASPPPTLVASPVAVVVTVPPTPLTRSDDPSPC